MKVKYAILSLLLGYWLVTSFQCEKCIKNDLRIGATKSWLPLKGRTQLSFIDNMGNLSNFKLQVADTMEIAQNDECNDTYKYEYVKATLYLNAAQTDSIHFSLSSNGWLCIMAASNSNYNMTKCNVFGAASRGNGAIKLNNYTIGAHSYKEAILILHDVSYPDDIDSVYIANNTGLVGFKYLDTRYVLQ